MVVRFFFGRAKTFIKIYLSWFNPVNQRTISFADEPKNQKYFQRHNLKQFLEKCNKSVYFTDRRKNIQDNQSVHSVK